VNSLFTMATVVSLSVSDLTEGATDANLGFESITFPSPACVARRAGMMHCNPDS
jgi:acyl dehydratase